MKAFVLILVVVVISAGIWYWNKFELEIRNNTSDIVAPIASKDDLIILESPRLGTNIKSPLTVRGRARGNWYFEASFPVKIYDANNKLLGQAPVQAIGEWMTTEYVPFDTSFSFATPTTRTGRLVLEKDNASGLPEHDNSLEIPVTFASYATTSVEAGTKIKLYYYNPSLDNSACSIHGLVAIERIIPNTTRPLTDAIQFLLLGEKSQGFTTEFPLDGLALQNAAIVNGVATLTFADPQNKTTGGSCRVSNMRNQIEATAKQFSSVKSVKILPETIFQP
jgi:hypothetical protein